MKSYSLELVQRKTGGGTLGKLAALAVLGAGAYLGYKNLSKGKAQGGYQSAAGDYDHKAHEGEDFTARILRAAKRVVK